MTLVLGVAGHVDHGKTALVRALTGMETDRLAEERARGISMVLGFAHLRLGDDAESGGEIDLIDMPGHERFVRTMIAGATGMGALLLVVDAREGVMPQTREHVDVAALLGVRRAIVAVSRTDLAEPWQVEAAARAASALVARAGLQASPPVPVSARSGAGLDRLRAAIADERRLVQPPADDGLCYLPVDRVFSVPGHGTVCTGTLRRGAMAAGDTVEIVPSGITARIRGLQVHGRSRAVARPGQRVAVNLRGIEPGQVPRGAALSAPGVLPAAEFLSVALHAVPDAPPLATAQPVRLLFGTSETEARLRLLDRDVLHAGQTALAQLRCATPVGVPARERFILRVAGQRTVAGGQILDPSTARARRHAPAVLARLAALAGAEPAGIVSGELARAGIAGAPAGRLARLATLPAARIAGLAADAVILPGGDLVSRPALEALMAVLPRVLSPYPDGVTREHLASLLPRAGRAVLDEALGRLVQAGTLARDGHMVRLRRPDRDKAAEILAAGLAEALRQAGLTPPDLHDLAPDPARRRLLARLVQDGVVVRAPDSVQKREILFHRDAIAGARTRLSTLLVGDGLLVGEVGAALHISRKFSVPLLEYLDSIRFTRRIGERRVVASA